MSQRQFDHLSDLRHLLSATANIIVANLIQVILLLVTLDRLALTVYDRVLSNDAIFWRVNFDNLELDLSHASAYDEQIALPNWSVCLSEVGSKVNVEEGAGETLNRIGNGQDCDTLGLQGAVRIFPEPPADSTDLVLLTYLISGHG
jgi:hypothetical protein